MYFKKTRGFTLVELLTVIIIITILIGLLFPALRKVREQARIDQARAMVGALEVAINMYYTDFGGYPPAASWESLLVNGSGGYGPYMDNKDYNGTDFIDPWNRPYNYALPPGTNNLNTYDVWSQGPNVNSNLDDIGNW